MREFTVGSAQNAVGGLTVANRALVTLNSLQPAAAPAANIEFLRHWVGQTANATSAQQNIALATQAAAQPTNALSVTPRNLRLQDTISIIAGATTIAAGKVGINIGTEGAGTVTYIWEDAFNVLNGYLKVPTPAETEIAPAGFTSAVTLLFTRATGTQSNWSWGQNYREV
jgi:hypothetical protein